MLISTQIDIQRYNESFSAEIALMANGAFGDNYLTEAKVKQMAKQDGSFYIALDNGKLAGFCCFLHLPATNAAVHLKVEEAVLVGELSRETPVCYTKTMAVSEEYRKVGLSARLFEACLADAERAGLHSAWGSAWKIGGHVPMDRIFKKNGFQVYGEIPDIWFDDKDYRCIVCGGPCRCSGVIYYKYFRSIEL